MKRTHDASEAAAMTSDRSSASLSADLLAWDKQGGLIPAIVQDASSLRVLMLGYMDKAALEATIATGHVTFFSRSRQQLWMKGETSGNRLDLVSIEADCDNDTLLLMANAAGPTCHLGSASCFPEAPGSELGVLDAVVASRHLERPQGSYSTRLFDSGVRRIAQKVGEEGVETALAGVVQDDDALLGESADLAYHLLMLLRARGLGLRDLEAVLRERAG